MLKEIFSEANGQLSSMRVNSFIALLMGLWVTWYTIENNLQSQNFNIIGLWLAAALIPKSISKFAESKK